MMEALENMIKIINNYSPLGTLGCSIFIVYKIVMASTSRWSEREQSYLTLLQNLGTWQNSLSDRLNYYQEPGSEYMETPSNPNFRENQVKGTVAYQNIREQISTSRIFLSEKAKIAIENLLGNYWYISEHGTSCTADYLRDTQKEVQKAYDKILAEAKKDLSKNRKLKFTQKLFVKDS